MQHLLGDRWGEDDGMATATSADATTCYQNAMTRAGAPEAP